MSCLSNKEINHYIINAKDASRLKHIDECKRCNMRYNLIKQTLDNMSASSCSIKDGSSV